MTPTFLSKLSLTLLFILNACSVPKHELKAGEHLLALSNLNAESRIYIYSNYEWIHTIQSTDGTVKYYTESGKAKLEENPSGYRLLNFGKLSKFYAPLKPIYSTNTQEITK